MWSEIFAENYIADIFSTTLTLLALSASLSKQLLSEVVELLVSFSMTHEGKFL